MAVQHLSFRKFLWMELIGFDNRQGDYGVGEFLSRMEIKPEVISILIWNTDLIHSHNGLGEDAPIGLKHCAYQARPRNEEHEIQNWTRFQLRGLISELHHHGVKVYVSFFDQLWSKEYQRQKGVPETDEWIDHHQEVRYVDCNGQQTSLCIWKHLADGSLYEDFFIRQLESFMRDYGFDGLHGADGYGHPRENIAHADFSDDMVGQFEEVTGIRCHVDNDSDDGPSPSPIPVRAQWILENVRKEWTSFHAKRHAQFWQKTIAMLERNGWGHAINTCWTRDPLEAYIRYGVDYKLLEEAGVHTWICEANAAAVELEGWNHTDTPKLDDYCSTLLRLKAFLPDSTMLLLHCVKDGLEQYNVLHHAPMFMETEVYAYANLFHGTQRVLDGVTVCLADGIRKDEWKMFDNLYRKAFNGDVASLPFPRVVWSDEAHRSELESYHYGQAYLNSHLLLAKLLAHGAVLLSIVRIDDLPETGAGPLVVLHPGFFSEEELAAIQKASGGEFALVGYDGTFDYYYDHIIKGFNFKRFKECKEQDRFGCALRQSDLPSNPYTWLCDLPELDCTLHFLSTAANQLNKYFSGIRVTENPETVRLWGYQSDDGLLHLFLANMKPTYQWPNVALKGTYEFKEMLSGGFVLPPILIHEDGMTRLGVKLPPMGTVSMLLSDLNQVSTS